MSDVEINQSKIYVIIVTYNGMKWIDNCLLSIRSSLTPLHVIIADNGSTDGTQAFIITNFPEVHLMQFTSNKGFGLANNLACKVAINEQADYLFLLNQDTEVYPDTIGYLLEAFKSDSRLGVVSPIHLNDSGSALDLKFMNYVSNNSIISDLLIQKPLAPFYQIGFVNAAAWLIKTTVIKEIGLFSDAFFHYGEDANFLQRLWYNKYILAIVPKSFIHHYREERKGQFNQEHLKRQAEINMLNMILNINDRYKTAYLKVIRYAGQQFFLMQINNAIKLTILPVINMKRYKEYRKSYKENKLNL